MPQLFVSERRRISTVLLKKDQCVLGKKVDNPTIRETSSSPRHLLDHHITHLHSIDCNLRGWNLL